MYIRLPCSGPADRTTPAETFGFNYAAHPLPLAAPAADPTLPAELGPAGVHRVVTG